MSWHSEWNQTFLCTAHSTLGFSHWYKSWSETGAAVNSVWPVGLQRKRRLATEFNDNSPDDSNDNPPAIPADCREPALCSPLPLLTWWRFILIWKDHQLDKERSARTRTCADSCGREIEHGGKNERLLAHACSHSHSHTHTHTHTVWSVLSNKETTIEKCPQVSVVTSLVCRCYYLPGTCSKFLSNCQPQLRL